MLKRREHVSIMRGASELLINVSCTLTPVHWTTGLSPHDEISVLHGSYLELLGNLYWISKSVQCVYTQSNFLLFQLE